MGERSDWLALPSVGHSAVAQKRPGLNVSGGQAAVRNLNSPAMTIRPKARRELD